MGETFDELGASEYYKLLAKKEGNNNIGNDVPKVDSEKNLKTYEALEETIKEELVNSSISLTSGGLAVALAKASIGGMLGCRVSLSDIPGKISSIDSALFSESQGRILVSIAPKNIAQFEKLMKKIKYKKIGQVSKNTKFIITDTENKKVVETNVKKLHALYHNFSDSMK